MPPLIGRGDPLASRAPPSLGLSLLFSIPGLGRAPFVAALTEY